MVARSGAGNVIMSSTAELRAVRQWFGAWEVSLPDAVSVVHVSEYLAGKLHDFEFVGDEEAVGYHDCAWLGRALAVYDEPRAVVTAASGRAPLELPSARGTAHSSGAGTSMYLTGTRLAGEIARMLLEEAEEAGMRALVTANPVDAAHLGRTAGVTGSPVRVVELAMFVAARLESAA